MLCTQCGAQAGVTDESCARCGTPLRSNALPRAETPADALLLAAIGKNAEYYVPRFERFAGGAAISWNWPSLFVPLPWFLYRKMWLHAVVYFLGALLAAALAIALLLRALGGVGLVLALGLWAAFRLAVLPMFANVLYYGVVEKRVANAKRRGDRPRVLGYLGRRGGTSNVALVLVMLLVPALGVARLAGIAMPAYRDYRVREQTAEGFQLAQPVQAAVVDAFTATGNVPSDLEAAGLPPDRIEGRFVDAVYLRDGRIDIRYGNGASVKLAGRVVSLTPYEVRNGAQTFIAWRCGQAPVPEGATRALAEYKPGDLAVDWPRWLPSSCRL
jgi:hypothetical protein